MIKPYIKNETAVDIICSICDRNSDGDMHYCSYGERKEESHD